MPDEPINGVPIPGRIRQLPRNKVGYPIPFFVDINPETNEFDFRLVDPRKEIRCINESLCWICGQRLNSVASFAIGPMCTVNNISAEPPSHQECALYAVKVCPFMTRPQMQRSDTNMPDMRFNKEGFIARNPGVMVVWSTRRWTPMKSSNTIGYMYKLGYPCTIEWYSKGRLATNDEVLDSLKAGLPALLESCVDTADTARIKTNYKHVLRTMIPGNNTRNGLIIRPPVIP
jgi:hypothetical protein